MSEEKPQPKFISVKEANKIKIAFFDVLGFLPSNKNIEIKIPEELFNNSVDYNYSIYADDAAMMNVVESGEFSLCGIKFVREKPKQKQTITLYEYVEDHGGNHVLVWHSKESFGHPKCKRTTTPPKIIEILDEHDWVARAAIDELIKGEK